MRSTSLAVRTSPTLKSGLASLYLDSHSSKVARVYLLTSCAFAVPTPRQRPAAVTRTASATHHGRTLRPSYAFKPRRIILISSGSSSLFFFVGTLCTYCLQLVFPLLSNSSAADKPLASQQMYRGMVQTIGRRVPHRWVRILDHCQKHLDADGAADAS